MHKYFNWRGQYPAVLFLGGIEMKTRTRTGRWIFAAVAVAAAVALAGCPSAMRAGIGDPQAPGAPALTGIAISPNTATIAAGAAARQLSVTATPAGAEVGVVTWTHTVTPAANTAGITLSAAGLLTVTSAAAAETVINVVASVAAEGVANATLAITVTAEGEDEDEPDLPDLLVWAMVSAGDSFVAAIEEDGSLWVWGTNAFGRTGLGITAGNTLVPTRIGTDNDWAYVSAGNSSAMAIRADGSLWAWGSNSSGATGLGITAGNTPVPTRVGTDNDWELVSAGGANAVGIRDDGSLWSWGTNANGATGLGITAGNTLVPTRVGADNDWAFASAGGANAVAIRADGSLWAWGPNNEGVTGLGINTGQTLEPARVGDGYDWEFVSLGSGSLHVAAIRADGSLWTWGINRFGETGLGIATANIFEPTRVGTGNDWISAATGGANTVGIRTDGSLWAWGNNANGVTGLGTTAGNTLEPARVGTGNDWELASVGGGVSAGIRAGGSLWTWGDNRSGATGLGITAGNTPEPTLVE